MTGSSVRRLAVTAALFTLACGQELPERGSDFDRAAGDGLKIATWNMQWLDRDNGEGFAPRSSADYQRLADYADLLDADIIAIQEIDGVEAAQRVFDTSVYDIHMSSRDSLQQTGFVYRKELDVTPQPDYTALGIGNLRYGTDIEVQAGGQTLRLLNVHLKSGCFTGRLPSSSDACTTLAQQVGPLEDWIDDRAAQGVPFMVLGDFNRRMFSRDDDDLWTAIDDGSPAGANLSSPTQSGSAQCNDGRFPEFIDHLVTGSLATEAVVPGSFDQLLYSPADRDFQLSDHCPISIELALEAEAPDDPPDAACAGACGGQSTDGCWCDDQCAQFGDCCPDKEATCDTVPTPTPTPTPTPDSCDGSCGGQAPGGCWCNPQCVQFGDCCDDYDDICS